MDNSLNSELFTKICDGQVHEQTSNNRAENDKAIKLFSDDFCKLTFTIMGLLEKHQDNPCIKTSLIAKYTKDFIT